MSQMHGKSLDIFSSFLLSIIVNEMNQLSTII